MATLQPVDFDPFAGSVPVTPGGVPVGASGRPRVVIGPDQSSTGPQLVPVDHDPFAEPSVAADVAKSAGIGAVKGGIGMVGAAGDIRQLLSAGVDYAAQHFGIPADKVQQFKDTVYQGANAIPMTSAIANAPTSGDIQKGIEQYTGDFYQPKTTAGEYAQTAGEFLPAAFGGEAGIIGRAARTLIPAATSETAGQLTKGSGYEPVARFLGALAGGGATALASRPGTAARAIQQQSGGITPQIVDQANALIQDAASRGIQLAWPEALSQVAGRPVMTNMMRHLEASPQTETRMSEFFAQRPQQVDTAVRGELDNIAPVNYAPESVGHEVSATARQFVQQSPEAGILADNLFRAGPRVTPEQAGAIMQNELRGVYDRREGMRAALADQDYTAARGAPATIPTNGGHRIADVTTHYLDRPNVPIILDRAERDAAKAQRLKDNNPTAPMPILGERPTQFSQVEAASVVDHINAALDTAKGSVRQVLQAAKSALMKPGGEIDGSIAGLHNSRVAITDLIDQAKRAGANGAVRELQGVLGTLDRALERVPAYQAARKNFQAASRPLEPFETNRTPGRIVERDQYNDNFVLPPDRATAAIEQGGPSAVRDFNSVATPAAREAFEQHIVTQVLDKASRDGADLSADSIRQAIRQNEDVLRQYPGVRNKLESVAIAREGLEKVEQLPIGKLAKRDLTTKKAVDALFPSNPLPNSQHEIASTMEELAKRNPRVASDLVRVHAESTFNQAAKDLQTGPNAANGAKFRAALIGNSQQRANLQAAVEALPNGAQRWQGFNRLLDILEATGTRQGIGSRTAYNSEINKLQGAGGIARDVAKVGANPTRLLQPLVDKYEQYKLGSNLNELADILTNPRSANLLRAAARAPQSSLPGIALRLVAFTQSSRPVENRNNR